MKEFVESADLFGYAIQARCTVLDSGLHILVIGGSKTHVGAISYCFPGEPVQTIQFPAHRDGVVSARWAERLCSQTNAPVTVACGIHYDNVSKAEINEIVRTTEHLLGQLEETHRRD